MVLGYTFRDDIFNNDSSTGVTVLLSKKTAYGSVSYVGT